MHHGESYQRGRTYLLVQGLLAAFVSLLPWILEEVSISSDVSIYVTSLLLFVLTLWAVFSWWHLTRSLFHPYVLFLLGVALFNGGQGFLHVFGLNPDGILSEYFSAEVTRDALLLVLAGLAYLHLGAFAAKFLRRFTFSRAEDVQREPLIAEPEDVRRVGVVLLVLSGIPLLLRLLGAINTVMAEGYGGLYAGDAATGLRAAPALLASFAIPGALFLLAGSRTHRVGRILAFSIITGFAGVYLFVGARGIAAYALIASAWVHHTVIRRIPTAVLMSVALALLFLVFPLVRVTRNVAGEDRTDSDVLLHKFTSIDRPLVASISEMGGSMAAVAYTLELVPAVREFDRGLGYVYSALAVVPSLFWPVHPSAARGVYSVWLVETVDSNRAGRGEGLGYSCIAEGYINFGWFGPSMVMGLLGFALVRFCNWAERADWVARSAMLGSFLSFFLFFPRGDSNYVFRPFVWYGLLPYLLVHVVRRWRVGVSRRGRVRGTGVDP